MYVKLIVGFVFGTTEQEAKNVIAKYGDAKFDKWLPLAEQASISCLKGKEIHISEVLLKEDKVNLCVNQKMNHISI